MKKLLVILSALVLCCTSLMFTACGDGRIQVGVLQFARHGSLDNCYEGVQAGLAENGYGADKVNLIFSNANGEMADNLTMAKSFVDRGVSAVVAIATPSAMAAAAAAQEYDIPVVFTAVSDPETMKSYKNSTGSCDILPLEDQVKLIKSFFPALEKVRIGVPYTLSEANSVANIKTLKALAAQYNVEIVECAVNKAEDLPLAIDQMLSKVDCVNNLTDNTVVQNLKILLQKANEQNIPVFGSEIEQVKAGCLASCSIDYVELGRRTGAMLAQILSGEKKPSDLEYLTVVDFETVYSSEVLAKFGLTLASDYQNIRDVKA